MIGCNKDHPHRERRPQQWQQEEIGTKKKKKPAPFKKRGRPKERNWGEITTLEKGPSFEITCARALDVVGKPPDQSEW